jgi:HAD superfamily hydrolase (TIGR01484 family)
MKKQAVFIDIDGCLTPGKNQAIPWEDVKALQAAFKKYDNFFEYIIVTARPATYAEAVVQFLGLMDTKKHKHAICESGGVCHLFGSDTYTVSAAVDHDILSDFESTLRRLQPVYKYNIEDGRKRTINMLPREGESPRGLGILLKEYLPEGLEMHNSAGGIDITPAKIDKAVACLELAEKIGIKITDSIAIGDSGGDLPLLNIVGHPACPANAFDSVKEVVESRNGFIAKNKHGLGVVEILEHYYRKVNH